LPFWWVRYRENTVFAMGRPQRSTQPASTCQQMILGVLDARVRTREAIEAVRQSGPQALQGPFKPREWAA
jgi:hypothetical protein